MTTPPPIEMPTVEDPFWGAVRHALPDVTLALLPAVASAPPGPSPAGPPLPVEAVEALCAVVHAEAEALQAACAEHGIRLAAAPALWWRHGIRRVAQYVVEASARDVAPGRSEVVLEDVVAAWSATGWCVERLERPHATVRASLGPIQARIAAYPTALTTEVATSAMLLDALAASPSQAGAGVGVGLRAVAGSVAA